MNNPCDTKQDLINENAVLKRRILELEKSNEALRKSERQFRSLAEATSDWIWELDANGVYTYSSPKVKELLGYEPEEVVGMKPFDFMPAGEADRMLALFTEISLSHRPFSELQNLNLRKDGREIILETSGVPLLDARANLVGYRGIDRDITERKRMEEELLASRNRLSRAEMVSRCGHWEFDFESRKVFASEGARSIYGLRNREWMIEEVQKLPLPEYRHFLDKALKELIDENRPYNVEFKIRRPDTGEVVDIHSVAEYDCRRNVVFGVIQDITEYKKAEEALQWKTALLEAQVNTSIDGIVVVDKDGKRIITNRRLIDLLGIPQHILDDENDTALTEYVVSLVKHPQTFLEKVAYLYDRPSEISRDEVEFKSGMVLDRYSAPVIGADGHYYGRIWTFRDITERKKAEQTLAEESVRTRILFEQSPDGIVIVDPETASFLDFNSAAHLQLGYSREEFAKLMISDVEANETLEEAKVHIADVITNGRADFETIQRTKQGEIRSVHVTAQHVSVQGTPVYHCIWRDITERKRVEEALKQSEITYRRIFESLEDVYFQTDNNGRIRIVSPSVQHVAGWTQEELIGSPVVKIYADPQDREAVLSALSDKGCVRDCDITVKTKDGIPVMASLSARLLFTNDGCPDGVAGVLRDITDRKMAEEVLQYETALLDAVVNSSQEGIYLLDVERQRVLENQRARNLWKMDEGVDDDEARVMHMVRSLKDAGPFRDKLLHLHGNPNDSIQLELELKDGTVLDCHSVPVKGMAGKNYGRLWTFRDITQLRHYAQMLEKLSGTDGLTALANRRRFDEVLDREWQRALRNQSSISLLMIDIDFFKAYNDRYGHVMGDDCLRLVASAIAETAHRPTDLTARYGGEEFACILPDTDLDGVLAVAHRILESVKALNIPHLSSTVADYVTVSIGAAALIPAEGQPSCQLVDSADMWLYRAKQSGRNQVRSTQMREAPPVVASIR